MLKILSIKSDAELNGNLFLNTIKKHYTDDITTHVTDFGWEFIIVDFQQ